MAKLLYGATMSLDGYIAGPGGDMSWMTGQVVDDQHIAERLLAGTGAILAGNGTFGGDDPNRGTDSEGAFGGQYHGPVFVLTHRPPPDPPADITFVGDLPSAIAQSTEAAGDKFVSIFGANVAKQCIEAKLLDQIVMFIVPVLLGDGVRMFEHPGGTTVRLTPVAGEAAHWYDVVY